MLFYPDIYINSVLDISTDLIKQHNIKGLILDVDNTLIDYDKILLDGAIKWCQDLKEQGIKFYIVSNSSKKEKVKTVADALEIPYINFAKKPFKKGFLEAIRIMDLKPENVAAVGDQLLTDVLGANRCKMTSILVDPVGEKDLWYTAIKRPLERKILNRYLKTQKKKED